METFTAVECFNGAFCSSVQWRNTGSVSRWQPPATPKRWTPLSTSTVSQETPPPKNKTPPHSAYTPLTILESPPPPGNSPDFKAGVMALASILKIQRHDDYLVMLKVGRTNAPTKFFHPALKHRVRILVFFYILQ